MGACMWVYMCETMCKCLFFYSPSLHSTCMLRLNVMLLGEGVTFKIAYHKTLFLQSFDTVKFVSSCTTSLAHKSTSRVFFYSAEF